MTDASRREILLAAGALAVTSTSALAAAPSGAAPPATWDLSELYPNAAAWSAEREAVLKLLPQITAFKGRLGTDAATLKAALQAASDAQRRNQRLSLYAGLIADSDTAVAAAQERRQLAIALWGQFGEATA